MRKKLLTISLAAFCCSFAVIANDEVKTTQEDAQVTTSETEAENETSTEEAPEQNAPTPLKVVGGKPVTKTVSNTLKVSQPVTLILDEELEDSEATIYDIHGRIVGQGKLIYPQTNVEI